MKKFFRKKSLKSNGFNSNDKSNDFRNALYASLITFIISPFSIFIAYKLNEILARPIISIEFVSARPIWGIQGLDTLSAYCTKSLLYKEYISKNLYKNEIDLRDISNLNKESSEENYIKLIDDNLNDFSIFINQKQNELINKISGIYKLLPSEVRILYLYETDNVLDDNIENMRVQLKDDMQKKLNEIKIANEGLVNIKKFLSLRISSFELKLSVLNKGSTDGLILNNGYIKIENEKFPIQRIAPPLVIKRSAVPTYDVNPKLDFQTSSIGKIEKNSMIECWYQVLPTDDSVICENICVDNYYEIILFDQNNETIKKLQKCKK